VFSCGKIGAYLTAHFGIGPMDRMMGVGSLAATTGTSISEQPAP